MQPYRKVNSTYSQTGTESSVSLGGSGSCQGDPGAPLTVMEEGRATLVAVASRGERCHSRDSRGIFTRFLQRPIVGFTAMTRSKL